MPFVFKLFSNCDMHCGGGTGSHHSFTASRVPQPFVRDGVRTRAQACMRDRSFWRCTSAIDERGACSIMGTTGGFSCLTPRSKPLIASPQEICPTANSECSNIRLAESNKYRGLLGLPGACALVCFCVGLSVCTHPRRPLWDKKRVYTWQGSK